jgi:hypothetical protein
MVALGVPTRKTHVVVRPKLRPLLAVALPEDFGSVAEKKPSTSPSIGTPHDRLLGRGWR